MDFALSEIQASWQIKGASLGRELAIDASAGDAVLGAVRAGLMDPSADLLAHVAAVEAIAQQSPAAAVAYALHSAVTFALRGDPRWADALVRGETIGALALSAAEVPSDTGGRLSGSAAWVAPVTRAGVAIVGARAGGDLAAFLVPLDARGVTTTLEPVAGLRGLACARLELNDVEAHGIGATTPVMARVRVLMAAVGLGIGQRAFGEALAATRAAGVGVTDEQTVQGLLADAATELDAARLLTWTAAVDGALSLGAASVAKLAATGAAQRAVERATQMLGMETFRQGHVIERLAQDVRALELFAGRTEALRSAVAAEILPTT